MSTIQAVLATAILAQIIAGDTTVLPAGSLGPLTTSGASYLSGEIKRSTSVFNHASTDLQSQTSKCNSLKETKTKTKCVPCIVEKCKAKASSCNRKLSFNGVVATVADLGHKVTSTVKDLGHKIADLGHKIFHGWGKRSRARRNEPSCSEIESNAGTACQKYESACPQCLFNPTSECPGYARAKSAYDSAVHTYTWLKKVPTSGSTYQVTKLTYNPTSFDPATQKFKEATAFVSVLGKTTSFRVNKPINIFIPDAAGPIIAQQALAWFKTH